MKMMLFSVFDAKTEAYMPPFVARAKGEAIRSFGDACKDGNRFLAHRGDYSLVYVGEFDDQTGVVSDSDPTIVVSGLDMVPRDNTAE